jgi:hypothetical protein
MLFGIITVLYLGAAKSYKSSFVQPSSSSSSHSSAAHDSGMRTSKSFSAGQPQSPPQGSVSVEDLSHFGADPDPRIRTSD